MPCTKNQNCTSGLLHATCIMITMDKHLLVRPLMNSNGKSEARATSGGWGLLTHQLNDRVRLLVTGVNGSMDVNGEISGGITAFTAVHLLDAHGPFEPPYIECQVSEMVDEQTAQQRATRETRRETLRGSARRGSAARHGAPCAFCAAGHPSKRCRSSWYMEPVLPSTTRGKR